MLLRVLCALGTRAVVLRYPPESVVIGVCVPVDKPHLSMASEHVCGNEFYSDASPHFGKIGLKPSLRCD